MHLSGWTNGTHDPDGCQARNIRRSQVHPAPSPIISYLIPRAYRPGAEAPPHQLPPQAGRGKPLMMARIEEGVGEDVF